MEVLPIATEISDCRIISVEPIVEPVVRQQEYIHIRELLSFIACTLIVIVFFILIMFPRGFTN